MTDLALTLLHESISKATALLGLPEPKAVSVPLKRERADVVSIEFALDIAFHFIASPYFPEVPPVIMAQWGNGDSYDYLACEWPAEGTPVEKIARVLDRFVVPGGTLRVAWGHDPHYPLTERPEIGHIGGWRKFLSGVPLVKSGAAAARERLDGTLVDGLSASRVLIFGLGSVGSYVSEQLTRVGVGGLILVDFDNVDPCNLSRTTFSLRDIGEKKVDALMRLLLNINPTLDVLTSATSLQDAGNTQLEEMFARVDLIIAATDDPAGQQIINACAHYADRPAVFIGLYRGAKGGEVAVTIPGLTPCFRCQTGAARAAASESNVACDIDYGTGRLQGEIALGCDIQHVTSAGITLSLSLLAAMKQTGAPLSELTIGAVQKGYHMLTMSMAPDYWFYPQVFDHVPGQHGFQSVWLTARSNPECMTCGEQQSRDNPFLRVAPDPDRTVLRELIAGFNQNEGTAMETNVNERVTGPPRGAR